MIKCGQSILDTLMDIMPGLSDKLPGLRFRIKKSPNYVDPVAANSLYSLWRAGSGDMQKKVYKKPLTLGHDELKKMKDAGLVRAIGENIEITDKGSNVIKIMILGDNKSAFDDDGIAIDYIKALESMRPQKTAGETKVATNWWGRFDNF